MATIREEIEQALVPKKSRKQSGNAAIWENLNVYLVRDNELAEIYAILTGNEFSEIFYNVDGDTYLKWDFSLDGFIDVITGSLYAAVWYSEDFEGGALPAEWTLVQGGENDWFVDTATSSTGTYSLYISTNGGTTNSYSSVGGGLDVSHAYLDIELPPVAPAILRLQFDWRCEGEVGFDYANVFNGLTSFTPIGDTEVVDGVDADLIGKAEYNDQSSWTTEQIDIPLAQVGTTRRFIWSWRNDSSVEGQPPIAIDNVKIIYG